VLVSSHLMSKMALTAAHGDALSELIRERS